MFIFFLEWIKWIYNKFTSARQEDPPPSDTVTTMDTPDMAMRTVGQFLEDVDLVPTEIDVRLHNYSIHLNLGLRAVLKYVDRGKDYCTVKWKKYTGNPERRTMELNYHQKFLDVFFNDFSTILQVFEPHLRELVILIHHGCNSRSTKKPLSKKFRLSKKYKHPDTTMLQLFNNYLKIMDFFDAHPITIKKLKITGLDEDQISQILSKIKTEELSIHGTVGGAESLDFDEIVKLENWESIKSLCILYLSVDHLSTFFIDKPTLYLIIDDISSAEIRLIIETFRNNPSMESWHLWFGKDMIMDVKDFLVNELGQPSHEDEWYFKVPGSEKVLNVSIYYNGTTLDIYYLKLEEIPKGVKIY